MILRLLSILLISLIISLNSYASINVSGVDGPLSEADVVITSANCTQGGSLVIPLTKPATYTFSWRNSSDVEISSDQSALNLYPGDYKLIYSPDLGINTYTLNFTVRSSKPTTATQTLTIPCGESSLMVHADNFSGKPIIKYIWEDESGRVLSNFATTALTAGKYYISVTDEAQCTSDKALVTILPTPFRPTIYEADKIVNNASCTSNDGSITGLKVVLSEPGPVSYRWVNDKGDLIGTSIDVYNLPPGKYRLTAVQSTAACESISTEITILLKNQITSNTNFSVTKTADCGLPNGSVTGVITNATSYQWVDVNNKVVATTLDLTNVSQGFYDLILFNDFGCSITIGPFHIQSGSQPIQLLTPAVIKPDNCGLNIGSITGITVPGSGIRYSWTNDAGQQISIDPELRNVPSGNYHLQVRNASCDETYEYYIPEVDLSLQTPSIGDKFICSPTEITINFDVVAPLYRVYDSNGSLVKESKSKDFKLIIKGNTTLYAAVANGACESSQTEFKITIGDAALKIPTSFTPNGDGINDKWVINGLELYSSANIKVFNRYGSTVYESSDNTNTFEGKNKGIELPAGVYYYIIKLTSACNPFSGSVTIIR
ncbi:gliding motility-associated-like protein [Pedobacter sp. UYP24]